MLQSLRSIEFLNLKNNLMAAWASGWLVALRREGWHVSAWDFLKVGGVVMTAALVAAMGVLWL